MAKKVQFPLKVQFIVDKVEGKLAITSSRIKFDLKLDEYPDLPSAKLINKMALTPDEQVPILNTLKALLKRHLSVEDT